MPNLTNPMKTDLDGGGHTIGNVAQYVAADGQGFGAGTATFANGLTIGSGQEAAFRVFAGTVPPDDMTIGGWVPAGCLYVHQIGPRAQNGAWASAALWFKTGPGATDWVKVA